MKRILIVSPHFPPSNLAAVHRSRLFAQHLPDFGWEPIIFTVHEKYYEEELDWNLLKLVSKELRIEKVGAIPTKPLRLVGDIGVRGFYQLYMRLKKIILEEGADFLYIPIPSHFASLLGIILNYKTGIKYGIDYIDPWVHKWPGTGKFLSKHWVSYKLSQILEPIALSKASIITGVAPGYYEPVLKRNPKLKDKVLTAFMPYGGEVADHKMVENSNLKSYLFEKKDGIKDFVYAGAMLPKAFVPLEEFLKSIANHRSNFKNHRFHFIGSGTSPNDTLGFNIKSLALKYNLWDEIIFEYPQRISYMDVLIHLNSSDGVFILGSTEPHYTPSKVFQAVLSKKPIFAILHSNSSACNIINSSKTGVTLSFDGELDVAKISHCFIDKWLQFEDFLDTYNPKNLNDEFFKNYAAKNITKSLVTVLNNVR